MRVGAWWGAACFAAGLAAGSGAWAEGEQLHIVARGPQVVMNTRNGASNGAVAVQDLEPIFQSKEVRQIYSYLVQQNGRKAMSEAEKQRNRLLDQLARQAQDLVQQSTVRRLH